jgi:hypothetical protein
MVESSRETRQDAMTSAQTMLARTLPTRGAVLALGILLTALTGCSGFPGRDKELVQPRVTQAPYDASLGEVLWAVIPLANESGTELVDPLVISDKLVAAAEEIQGVRTVPLNRTLQAMHALGLKGIKDPGEVKQLAALMGVDGIIVGTITAYDPYDPPTLGLSLALYARTDAMGSRDDADPIDPRALSEASTDTMARPALGLDDRPAAVVSAHLDARDHGVLMALREYAEGRHDPASALGWKRYTASMDLYTQFAAQHLVAALVEQEHQRLASLAPVEESPTR